MPFTTPSATKTTLLTLPAGNQIFGLILISKYPLHARKYLSRDQERYRPGPAPPALVRVSKQTRIEGLPIFYGSNAFYFALLLDVGPVDWSYQMPSYLTSSISHMRKIILRDASFKFRWQVGQPHEVELVLSLDEEGTIKASYLSPFRAACTCHIESAARNFAFTFKPASSAITPLLYFPRSMGKARNSDRHDPRRRDRRWHWDISDYREAKKRTESCKCGIRT